MADEDYVVFVNDESTVMVRVWVRIHPDTYGTMEVALRESPDSVWGPPITVKVQD